MASLHIPLVFAEQPTMDRQLVGLNAEVVEGLAGEGKATFGARPAYLEIR